MRVCAFVKKKFKKFKFLSRIFSRLLLPLGLYPFQPVTVKIEHKAEA